MSQRRRQARTAGNRSRAVAVAAAAVVGAGLLLSACSSSSSSSSDAAAAAPSGTQAASPPASSSGAVPGVTATSITVGQVDELSAPVQGMFQGAEIGAQAYFNYINSQGGVYGRTIKLDARDTQFNAGTLVAEAKQEAASDFAFVGSYSILDSALAPVLAATGTPYIGVPISQALVQDPNVFTTWAPPLDQIPTGAFEYFAHKYPAAVKHVGIIYGTNAAALWDPIEAAAESAGWKFIYSRGYGLTETNFLPDAIKMKAAGVQLVYSFGSGSAVTTAQFLRSAQQANFDPIEVQSENYFTTLSKLAGPAANGVYFPLTYALYAGEDAATVPEVALMDKWVKADNSSYAAYSGDLVWGWSSAMLFVDALKAAGPDPTRAKLVAALEKQTAFDAAGLLPPSNISNNTASGCWLLAQMNGGKYQRVSPTPASGFICNPGGLDPVPGTPAETKRG
jgi:ABC-type branched-subunit amino acid transport system substrate-binding protein